MTDRAPEQAGVETPAQGVLVPTPSARLNPKTAVQVRADRLGFSITRRWLAWIRRRFGILLGLGVAALAIYALMPVVLGPRVAAYAVNRQDLTTTVVASGRVQTPYRAAIGSQITGTVAAVPVEEGQSVRKGQALVVLASDDLAFAVSQAQAAVAEAQAHLRQVRDLAMPAAREARVQTQAGLFNVRRTFERQQQLFNSGFATQAALDDARRNLDAAEAQDRVAALQVQTNAPGGSDWLVANTALGQARAALAVTKAKLAYAVIRAPSDGVLIARDVERGDVVAPGKTLMVLSPTAATQLVINVDEKNLGQLAVGQGAVASADAFPSQRFAARVNYINPGVDASTATVQVKLLVPSPPAYLRQDMTVSVDIEAASRPKALVLPADGVRDAFSDHPYVLEAQRGRAVAIPVRLGLRGGGVVEIASGLRQGDLVLPATSKIQRGQRVRAYRGG